MDALGRGGRMDALRRGGWMDAISRGLYGCVNYGWLNGWHTHPSNHP